MKRLLSLIAILITTPCLFSQNIERKIIVQNNSFFYSTIHDEFQIATLNVGSFTESLADAKKLAVPAGRNYNEPVNPFSWDMKDSTMYAVNFLNHPLNSKNDALKQFQLSTLKEWSKDVTVMDLIMKSVDENRFAYNEPYKFMMHHSNYLNNFFFDAIVLTDSSFMMVIANNNELTIWKFVHGNWTHSALQPFVINGFFTLFEWNKQPYIIFNNGQVHKVYEKEMAVKPEMVTNKKLIDHLLILDRDKNTVQLIKINEINMRVPFNELLKYKGIPIF